MLQIYTYHIVNVFAESHFGGNPLAVFSNADGLTDKQMQAIAQQFNLSETVFLLAPTAKHGVQAIADLRIFTPNYELPLAGHPTLGSAFILSQLNALPDQFVLNTVAKPVDITINQNSIVVKIHGFEWAQSHLSKTVLAHASGLQESDISNKAYFINSGTQQILIELANREALKNLQIDKDLLRKINQDNKFKTTEQPSVYYWYQVDDIIYSRMFFEQNHVMVEDSGTGSACANLGAYFISQNQYPIHK